MNQQIGKYRILERIGRGGMGSVYKAHDPVLDRMVALKVVSAETDHTDELRARFFREAQACAKLSHPNIVTIHDLGEADGNLFIVMELLEGDELRQVIAKRSIANLEDKFPLMIQICDGLEFAHDKGIVHRDVKPANIFVLRNGQVKILDFGIAQIAAAQTGLTRAGLILTATGIVSAATVRYAVDEQGGGAIFALGFFLYLGLILVAVPRRQSAYAAPLAFLAFAVAAVILVLGAACYLILVPGIEPIAWSHSRRMVEAD